jgi:glycosyltransferase involved in cell wall biosynthesis
MNSYKKNKNQKITIITVVYNDAKNIEKTILSVKSQNYIDVEYIIIDGDSNDGTLEIINRYRGDIDILISEPDGGIYDAMNKGIDKSTGVWVNFLNSGDAFYDNNLLSKIFNNANYDGVDIIYGNWEVIYPSGNKKLFKAGKLSNLWKGSQFCHQASFINLEYHKKNKYNLNQKITADFEFFYNAYKRNAKFLFYDSLITTYSSGGLSDVNRMNVIVNWFCIIEKNLYVKIYYALRLSLEILKDVIKKSIKLIKLS